MPEFGLKEEEWPAAWRGAPHRTDYKLPCDLTAGIPEHIGAVSFMPDGTEPSTEGIGYILEGLFHALRHGGTFVLLCEDRTVWERCTAIVAAALAPAGETLQ